MAYVLVHYLPGELWHYMLNIMYYVINMNNYCSPNEYHFDWLAYSQFIHNITITLVEQLVPRTNAKEQTIDSNKIMTFKTLHYSIAKLCNSARRFGAPKTYDSSSNEQRHIACKHDIHRYSNNSFISFTRFLNNKCVDRTRGNHFRFGNKFNETLNYDCKGEHQAPEDLILDLFKIKHSILCRLKTCINDRSSTINGKSMNELNNYLSDKNLKFTDKTSITIIRDDNEHLKISSKLNIIMYKLSIELVV